MQQSNEAELTGRKGGGLTGLTLSWPGHTRCHRPTGRAALRLGPGLNQSVRAFLECGGRGGHLAVTQPCFLLTH